MSNEPLIVAARRRARMLSRQTGASYQTHLDIVAQQVGRENWAAFLKDPVQTPPDEDGCDVHEDAESTDDGLDVRPDREKHRSRRHAPFSWIKVLAALLLVTAAIAIAAYQEIRLSEASSIVMTDRASHGSADWFQRNIPMARNVISGDMHMVDLVFIDSRVAMASWTYSIPKWFGYDARIIYGGDKPEMRKAMQDNPIIMIRMHANCRTGKWRMAALISTGSYEGRPVMAEYQKRHRKLVWLDMNERNRHAVCDAPDSAEPEMVEIPTKAQRALQTMPAGDPAARSDEGDALWYGIDILHPRYPRIQQPNAANGILDALSSFLRDAPPADWDDVTTPRDWTSAAQNNGWTVPVDDEGGPFLELRLKTRTAEAARAAARNVAAEIVKRFDMGPDSGLLETAGGNLTMTVKFSATGRADRPTSSVLRVVTLMQHDEGIELRVRLRNRYVRNLKTWRRSQKA